MFCESALFVVLVARLFCRDASMRPTATLSSRRFCVGDVDSEMQVSCFHLGALSLSVDFVGSDGTCFVCLFPLVGCLPLLVFVAFLCLGFLMAGIISALAAISGLHAGSSGSTR